MEKRFGRAPLLLTLLAGLSAAGLTSCDRQVTKLQYMPDMADAPFVKAQRDWLPPPDGSVAMTAPLYPASLDEAGKVLHNPYPATPENIAQGKALFDTFCIPCHGPNADGHGTVVPPFPQPPNITQGPYPARPDGFFFYTISFGSASGIMPRYGYAISPYERWKIVLYVRSLQQKGGSK